MPIMVEVILFPLPVRLSGSTRHVKTNLIMLEVNKSSLHWNVGLVSFAEKAPRADKGIDRKKADRSYELTDAERKEKTQVSRIN